jgi:hypothetical protein
VLSEALVQVHRDPDIVAVVLALQDIDDGEDDDGFEVHL